MMQTQTNPPKQVLLRLPDDLAAQLARAVPPRQRNRYIVDLLAKNFAAQLEAESHMLMEAAERMNALEAQYPELARETQEWVGAELTASVDVWDTGFDAEIFSREASIAQAQLNTSSVQAGKTA